VRNTRVKSRRMIFMVTKYLKKKIAIALVAAMAIGGVTPTQIVPSFKMENVKAEGEAAAEPTAAPEPIVAAEFIYDTKMLKVGEKDTNIIKPVALGNTFYYQTVLYGNDGKPGALKANKWVAIEAAYNENNSASTRNYTNVDFSWLSCTRMQDLYIAKDAAAVTAGTETPVKITIAAQNTSLKISYYGILPTGDKAPADGCSIGNGFVGYFVSEKKGNNAAVPFTDLEWKTENDDWWDDVVGGDYEFANQLTQYINKGIKLQFRVKPGEGNVAGKTITVSVPAKPNGPKVTVDYNKQTVVLPAKSEYINADLYEGAGTTGWTAVGDKKVTKFFDQLELKDKENKNLKYDGSTTIKVYVRTVAANKKAPSKLTLVTLGKAIETTTVTVADGESVLPVEYSDGTAADSTDGKVYIQYSTPYNKKSGVLITNHSTTVYQVAIVEKDKLTDFAKKEGELITGYEGFNANAEKMGIGSIIKFTDVKGYTTKTKNNKIEHKVGKATIKTNNLGDDFNKYVLLYRIKADSSSTAPGKVYCAEMPVVLGQTLTVSDGAGSDAIVSTNATQNENAKQLVGTAELKLTCSVSPEFSSSSKSVAKVYTKSSDDKYTEYKNFTVTIDKNKKDVAVKAKSTAVDGTYYVGVTLEGVTTYYKISYVKTVATPTPAPTDAPAPTPDTGD